MIKPISIHVKFLRLIRCRSQWQSFHGRFQRCRPAPAPNYLLDYSKLYMEHGTWNIMEPWVAGTYIKDSWNKKLWKQSYIAFGISMRFEKTQLSWTCAMIIYHILVWYCVMHDKAERTNSLRAWYFFNPEEILWIWLRHPLGSWVLAHHPWQRRWGMRRTSETKAEISLPNLSKNKCYDICYNMS